jgi:hypothetical protein
MDTTLMNQLSLFLHIIGAFGLIAALTFEGIGLRGLRRSVRAEDARVWLGLNRVVQRFAPASLAVIIVTGLYLMATGGGPKGWILVALASLVAVAAIGGLLTGVRMARIGPSIGRASGPLSDRFRGLLRDPVLLASFRVRLAIVIGIALLMSLKPSVIASLVVVVTGAVVALVAGAVTTGRHEVGTQAPGASPQHGRQA